MKTIAPRDFTATARALHWAIAILMLSQFATNWLRAAAERGSALRGFWLEIHVSAGILVFVLTLIRMFWRFYAPPPQPLGNSLALRLSAQVGHGLLYLLTFVTPITGFLRATAGGRPLAAFGLSIPSPFVANPGFRHLMFEIHGSVMEYVFIAMICGHMAAAFWHQLVLRDGTFKRMALSVRQR